MKPPIKAPSLSAALRGVGKALKGEPRLRYNEPPAPTLSPFPAAGPEALRPAPGDIRDYENLLKFYGEATPGRLASAPMVKVPLSKLDDVRLERDLFDKYRSMQTEPPAILIRREPDGKITTIDGSHRTWAAREKGAADINALDLTNSPRLPSLAKNFAAPAAATGLLALGANSDEAEAITPKFGKGIFPAPEKSALDIFANGPVKREWSPEERAIQGEFKKLNEEAVAAREARTVSANSLNDRYSEITARAIKNGVSMMDLTDAVSAAKSGKKPPGRLLPYLRDLQSLVKGASPDAALTPLADDLRRLPNLGIGLAIAGGGLALGANQEAEAGPLKWPFGKKPLPTKPVPKLGESFLTFSPAVGPGSTPRQYTSIQVGEPPAAPDGIARRPRSPNEQLYARPHGERATRILKEQDARIKAGQAATRNLNQRTRDAFESLGEYDVPSTLDELDTRADRFAPLAMDDLTDLDAVGPVQDSAALAREASKWNAVGDRLLRPDFNPPRSRYNAWAPLAIGGGVGAAALSGSDANAAPLPKIPKALPGWADTETQIMAREARRAELLPDEQLAPKQARQQRPVNRLHALSQYIEPPARVSPEITSGGSWNQMMNAPRPGETPLWPTMAKLGAAAGIGGGALAAANVPGAVSDRAAEDAFLGQAQSKMDMLNDGLRQYREGWGRRPSSAAIDRFDVGRRDAIKSRANVMATLDKTANLSPAERLVMGEPKRGSLSDMAANWFDDAGADANRIGEKLPWFVPPTLRNPGAGARAIADVLRDPLMAADPTWGVIVGGGRGAADPRNTRAWSLGLQGGNGAW